MVILCIGPLNFLYSYEIPSQNWKVAPGNFALEEPPKWFELDQFPFNGRTREDLLEGQSTLWQFTLEKEFDLSTEELDSITHKDPEIWIRFSSNVSRFFLNGTLLHSRGEMNPDGTVKVQGFRRNFSFPIPRGILKEGKNTFRIILEGHVNDEIYIMTPFIIDSAASHILRNNDTVDIMLCFLYLFLGFYHLLLYSKRRQEDYNLWFGLFTVALSSYIFTRTNFVFKLEMDDLWLKRWEYFNVAMAACLSPIFFVRFFQDQSTKFSRFLNYTAYIYAVVVLLLQISNLFRNNGQMLDSLRLWQLTMPAVMLPLALTIIIRNMIKKNWDAWRLSVGMGVLFFTIILDLLGSLGVAGLDNLGLSAYGFLVFVIGIAFVLANRFLRVHNEVEELNENLEKKVEERTAELNESLKKVQTLKEQQDGDYFLTSLLLKPLSNTSIRADNIKIESFIKQKKNFHFQNKNLEIGGDINIAHNIRLNNRDYVLFLNGDAMGKSIQGAGGALVLGTVFQSIVDRTKATPREQTLYPERWLKNTFIEMHKVFASFDGSMLMSITMGLLDTVTGTTYYINAEHPYSILFRDGKANFLETDVELRKLGTTITFTSIHVTTAQLEAGDSIILGSDGRDDILLGHDETGARMINEDETQILRVLEKSEGNLTKTFEILKSLGELTDDLSLMKITLLHKSSPAVDTVKESNYLSKAVSMTGPNSLDMLKSGVLEIPGSYKIAKEYFNRSMNFKIVDHVRDSAHAYFSLYSEDSDSIKHVAFLFESLNELDLALDFAERFRLRFPHDTENLGLLVKIYKKKERKDLVETFTKKLISLPGGDRILAGIMN